VTCFSQTRKNRLLLSLCFAAFLSDPLDLVLLRQCADMWYPLAQAEMAWRAQGEEKFQFAKSSASQRERDGLPWLGWCYARGNGCERDLEKTRECFQIAAQLGFVSSMRFLGNLLDESDPQRWIWFG
jgi:TPR repeat protein